MPVTYISQPNSECVAVEDCIKYTIQLSAFGVDPEIKKIAYKIFCIDTQTDLTELQTIAPRDDGGTPAVEMIDIQHILTDELFNTPPLANADDSIFAETANKKTIVLQIAEWTFNTDTCETPVLSAFTDSNRLTVINSAVQPQYRYPNFPGPNLPTPANSGETVILTSRPEMYNVCRTQFDYISVCEKFGQAGTDVQITFLNAGGASVGGTNLQTVAAQTNVLPIGPAQLNPPAATARMIIAIGDRRFTVNVFDCCKEGNDILWLEPSGGWAVRRLCLKNRKVVTKVTEYCLALPCVTDLQTGGKVQGTPEAYEQFTFEVVGGQNPDIFLDLFLIPGPKYMRVITGYDQTGTIPQYTWRRLLLQSGTHTPYVEDEKAKFDITFYFAHEYRTIST